MRVKRHNSLTLIFTTFIFSISSVVLWSQIKKHKTNNTETSKTIEAQPLNICETETQRLEGFKFVKPLMFNYKTCESGKYNKLKTSILDLINQRQQTGRLDKISIYLKLLNNREFIGINENEMFHPGSLIKLPLLITFLKMEELSPGTLNKQVVFNLPQGGVPHQTYNTIHIEPEKSYTIKDLLKYMIAYSDNNATYLLNNCVDISEFKKTFSDFGLVVPDVTDRNYKISAKEYSVFLNVLYNAGYLTITDSEFATELLNKCNFKEGIQRGIPPQNDIVHKFGEWGDVNNHNIHQLSESGIIYLDKCPYILTIMTQGKEITYLPTVLSDISKIIYDYLKIEAYNL